MGEFLITGDIYFQEGSRYILYWKIVNGELKYQQRDELNSFYLSEFKKCVRSQKAVLEAERKTAEARILKRQKERQKRKKKIDKYNRNVKYR